MENQQSGEPRTDDVHASAAEADRRKFLASLGRFTAATPPAITLLLSTTLSSNAIAHSGGGGHGHHGGHHGGDRDHDERNRW